MWLWLFFRRQLLIIKKIEESFLSQSLAFQYSFRINEFKLRIPLHSFGIFSINATIYVNLPSIMASTTSVGIKASTLLLSCRRVNVPNYREAFVALRQQIVSLTTTINNMHVEYAPTTHTDFPFDEKNVPEDNPFAPFQPTHPHYVAPLAVLRPDRAIDDT